MIYFVSTCEIIIVCLLQENMGQWGLTTSYCDTTKTLPSGGKLLLNLGGWAFSWSYDFICHKSCELDEPFEVCIQYSCHDLRLVVNMNQVVSRFSEPSTVYDWGVLY